MLDMCIFDQKAFKIGAFTEKENQKVKQYISPVTNLQGRAARTYTEGISLRSLMHALQYKRPAVCRK